MKLNIFLKKYPVLFNNNNFSEAIKMLSVFDDLGKPQAKFIDDGRIVLTYLHKDEGCIVFDLVQNDGTHLTDFHEETVENRISTVRRKESSYIVVKLCFSHDHNETTEKPYQIHILPADSTDSIFKSALEHVYKLHLHMKEYTVAWHNMLREYDTVKQFTCQ